RELLRQAVEDARRRVFVDHASTPRSDRRLAQMRELRHFGANALGSIAEIEGRHHATASHASGDGFKRRPFIDGGTGGPHGVQAMPTFWPASAGRFAQ